MSALQEITVGQVVSGAGLLLALVVILRKVNAGMKRISDLLDDWFGERPRPGVPERKGVMQRLSDQDAALKDVQARMEPLITAASLANYAEVLGRLEVIAASSEHSASQLVKVETLLLRHIRESQAWVQAVDVAASARDFQVPSWPSLPDDPDSPAPTTKK